MSVFMTLVIFNLFIFSFSLFAFVISRQVYLSSSEDLNLTSAALSDKTDSLRDKIIKISFGPIEYMPYVSLKTDLETNQINYGGMVYEITTYLAKRYKFKFEIVKALEMSFGVLKNGTWDGLIGMLVRQEVDLVVAPLTVTYLRSQAVDFSTPFNFEPCGILVRLPVEKLSMWKMLFVFSNIVWISIASSFIVTVLIIYSLNKMAEIYGAKIKKHRTLVEIALYVFRHITTQEGRIVVEGWSNRMFQISWRICVFFLVAMYTGSLTAVLSTSKVQLPFTDLLGLTEAVARNEYKICMPDGNAFYGAIMTSESPQYKILRKFLSENKEYIDTIANCNNKFAADEKIALIGEATYLKEIQNDFCEQLQSILLDDRFFPGYYSLAMVKNSYLTPIFSEAVLQVVEGGMIDGWKSKYSPKTFCAEHRGLGITANSMSVSFQSIGGIFIIFVTGVTFGIFAFFIEVGFCKK